MVYLTVAISGKVLKQVRQNISIAKSSGAEMLELRCDYLSELNRQNVCACMDCARQAGLPFIVTCRDAAQGGAKDWSCRLRTDVLVCAAQYGADFIDCEYENFLLPQVRKVLEDALAAGGRTRLILSAHKFDGPWERERLFGLYEDICAAYKGCVPKIVYTANHVNDCFDAFDLLMDKKGDAIVLCMGAAGQISRIICRKLGSLVSFASVNPAEETAAGQIPAEKLHRLYRWRCIGEKTELFGVIGWPVEHSLGPAVFNACFDADDLDAVYMPVLLAGGKEEFDIFLKNVLSRPYLGFGGFSVTMPHKTHALDFVNSAGESVEPLAESIGAVNTLKIGFGGILTGYNTDCAGAVDALAAGMGIDRHGLHGVKAVVLGAGGVGRAVVAGLCKAGVVVIIYNRTGGKAKSLAEEFGCKWAGWSEIENTGAEVIINCTSMGMYPDTEASPLPQGLVRGGMVVFDTVYNPLKTLLLRQAQDAGAKIIGGDEMFIRQAAAQYRIFTGLEARAQIMRKIVSECLS